MIHLEGMGITGCLLAVQLERLGVPFTWHDTDVERTAWKASTGCIYPAGSTKFGPDWECYQTWRRWHEERLYAPFIGESNYWFGHKSTVPHEGKGLYEVRGPTEHGLRGASVPSLHLNAQRLVPLTQRRFENSRVTEPALYETRKRHPAYIVTHGFSRRQAGAYWGWNRWVKLRYDTKLYGPKACFYFRPSKVQMAYAFPIPGVPWWYAGSSIILQRPGKEKSLVVLPKYETWKKLFTKLANGAIEVTQEGRWFEGWRPICADEEWVTKQRNVYHLRPLWNSGIRHFPYQWKMLLTRLIADKIIEA